MDARYRGWTRKQIRARLTRVINQWTATLPPTLATLARRDAIITGGSIASMLLGERVKDFDVYLSTRETALALAEHYIEQFIEEKGGNTVPFVYYDADDPLGRIKIMVRSSGVDGEMEAVDGNEETDDPVADGLVPPSIEPKSEETPDKQYVPRFLSENAITLSDKFQIVIRFWGPVEEIHKNYDFVHATCAYTSWDQKLYLPPAALESMMSKTLVYQGSLYPVCSLFRLRKFMDRGWKVSAGEMTKIALQISRVDLTNIDTLREQLIGVDALYFHMLVVRLREWQRTTGNTMLDTSYVINLIDDLAENDKLGLN